MTDYNEPTGRQRRIARKLLKSGRFANWQECLDWAKLAAPESDDLECELTRSLHRLRGLRAVR